MRALCWTLAAVRAVCLKISKATRVLYAGIELNTQAAQFARRTFWTPNLRSAIRGIPKRSQVRCHHTHQRAVPCSIILRLVPLAARCSSSRRQSYFANQRDERKCAPMESGSLGNSRRSPFSRPRHPRFLVQKIRICRYSPHSYSIRGRAVSPVAMATEGRNRIHNVIKSPGVRTPMALPALKKLYSAALGQRLYISFIVLTALRRKKYARPPSAISRLVLSRRVAGSH